MRANLLLMDERPGRQVAEHLGIRCLGLVGLLIWAKRRGKIAAVRPRLEALRDVAGFRLSHEFMRRVMQDEEEG